MATRAISLRIQILLLFLILAIFMAVIFSLQSAHNLLKTFDFHETHIMHRLAEETVLPDGTAVEALGFHIASNWSDVPDNIRERFSDEPKRQDVLYSHFEDWIFFAPPKRHYLLLKTSNRLGEIRYVSQYRVNKDRPPILIRDEGIRIDPMVEIALWGLGVTITFVLVFILALRWLARPVEALYLWAKQLNLDELEQPIPKFKFEELNSLAKIVHTSVASVAESLQKEHEFLQYASHELRTPISILRSNSVLLDKVNPTPSEKEREVRDRITRASLSMKGITEILLWLGREEEYPVPYEAIDLSLLLSQIVTEQQFLTEGKNIDLALQLEAYTQYLPGEACRILLTNMIRNAFQHTNAGTIRISQQENQIVIENPLDEGTVSENGTNEIGFGLGLKLSYKLADKFDWGLVCFQQQGLNIVEISLTNHH
jgi:signal transduction histidine kinase